MRKNKKSTNIRHSRHISIVLTALLLGVTATACNAGTTDTDSVQDTEETTEADIQETTEGDTDSAAQEDKEQTEIVSPLTIVRQGVFSSGGVVTNAVSGEYDAQQSWRDSTRAGNTAHIDHASVFYQIPEEDNGNPIIYLHGYRQSRVCWMTTPDGRDGFSTLFLRNGHSAFLIDQPRSGEAGATSEISEDTEFDMWYGEIRNPDDDDNDYQEELPETATKYQPGDQAWYTYYRIGETPDKPNRNSQFPADDAALNQFLRQTTPNTGNYDNVIVAKAIGEVVQDVNTMTGQKAIFMGHGQGCSTAWNLSVENISAIVAIEPISVPEAGSSQYQKLLEASVPIVVYYGDYITSGDTDLASTEYWQDKLAAAEAFAEQYTEEGGDCTVVELPAQRINGNSHFLFQEANNQEIADLIETWLGKHGLN